MALCAHVHKTAHRACCRSVRQYQPYNRLPHASRFASFPRLYRLVGPMTTDAMISWVIEREGGAKFTDDPADRGGATKFGITAATLGRARRQPSPADVEE